MMHIEYIANTKINTLILGIYVRETLTHYWQGNKPPSD